MEPLPPKVPQLPPLALAAHLGADVRLHHTSKLVDLLRAHYGNYGLGLQSSSLETGPRLGIE